MSGKNQAPNTFNWQTIDPQLTLLPLNNNTYGIGSLPSGTLSGAMASTNVIYSNIIDVSRMDSVGIEVNWTGTPTGVLQVMCSNSGKNGNFFALTFNPAFNQPAGSAGNEGLVLQQVPFKYLYLIYTNTSGTGVLTAYGQVKDFN